MKIEDILNKQESDFKNKTSLLEEAAKQNKLETVNREIEDFLKESKVSPEYPVVDIEQPDYNNLLYDPLAKKEWKLMEVNNKLFQDIINDKKKLDRLFADMLRQDNIMNSDLTYLPETKHFFDFFKNDFSNRNSERLRKVKAAEISENVSESDFYSKQFENNPGNGGAPSSISEQEKQYKEKNSEKSFVLRVLENIDISLNDKYSSQNPDKIGINRQIEDYEKKTKELKKKSDEDFQTNNVSTSIAAGSPSPNNNNYDYTQNMASPKFKGRPGQTESIYSAVYYWLSDLMYYMSGRKPGSQGQQAGDYPGSVIYKKNIPLLPSFILWQTTLHGMNPQFGQGQVWSPTDFAAAFAPGTLTNTADTGFSADLQGKQKGRFDIPNITQVEGDMDDPVYGSSKLKVYSRPLMNFTRGLENTIQKGKIQAITNPTIEPTGYFAPKSGNIIFSNNDKHSGKGSRYYPRDVAFNLKTYTPDSEGSTTDIDKGIFETGNQIGLIGAIKSETYIPFFFKDLRPNGSKNRFLLFRAFIDSISEGFSPSVSTESFFGRTDPIILSDTSVTRTIDLSFKMVALSPNDVDVMYKKLNWLTSMVYCEYDNLGYVKLGPLLQLRVGDLISDERGNGINGKITSLKYDYGKYLWEVGNRKSRDGELVEYQVPLAIDISLGYTVAHSKPIKIQSGLFKTENLRKVGKIA